MIRLGIHVFLHQPAEIMIASFQQQLVTRHLNLAGHYFALRLRGRKPLSGSTSLLPSGRELPGGTAQAEGAVADGASSPSVAPLTRHLAAPASIIARAINDGTSLWRCVTPRPNHASHPTTQTPYHPATLPPWS